MAVQEPLFITGNQCSLHRTPCSCCTGLLTALCLCVHLQMLPTLLQIQSPGSPAIPHHTSLRTVLSCSPARRFHRFRLARAVPTTWNIFQSLLFFFTQEISPGPSCLWSLLASSMNPRAALAAHPQGSHEALLMMDLLPSVSTCSGPRAPYAWAWNCSPLLLPRLAAPHTK